MFELHISDKVTSICGGGEDELREATRHSTLLCEFGASHQPRHPQGQRQSELFGIKRFSWVWQEKQRQFFKMRMEINKKKKTPVPTVRNRTCDGPFCFKESGNLVRPHGLHEVPGDLRKNLAASATTGS